MKVEQAEEQFQPITITLESAEECELMMAALSKVGVGVEGHVNFTYNIYRYLYKRVPSGKYTAIPGFNGHLSVTKKVD